MGEPGIPSGPMREGGPVWEDGLRQEGADVCREVAQREGGRWEKVRVPVPMVAQENKSGGTSALLAVTKPSTVVMATATPEVTMLRHAQEMDEAIQKADVKDGDQADNARKSSMYKRSVQEPTLMQRLYISRVSNSIALAAPSVREVVTEAGERLSTIASPWSSVVAGLSLVHLAIGVACGNDTVII